MFARTRMENKLLPLIEVECQASLGAGMTILERKEFNAVLLNLTQPDSTGLDTFRKLHTQYPNLPLIILTSLDGESTALEAVREGAQDYFVKGRAEANELTMAIRNAVERKRLEEENRLIHARLVQAQKMEAVGILAGGVAHDFNNLITAIRGSVDMALFKCEASHPMVKDLRNIQTAADRASQLTRQIILLSQKHHKEFVLFNLNEAVESIFKMLHRILGEDIAVQTDLRGDIWQVRADRGSLEQVLLNLAVRAREAMQEKGGSLVIRTENVQVDDAACQKMKDARVGRYVRMTATDTGRGLTPDAVEHLFEAFTTGKGGTLQGTGLGLSVVQGIIKEHEGWISVRSSERSGSAFEIYLPAVTEKSPTPTSKKIPFEWLKGRGEKILVVEDEEGIREFVRRSLNEMGYAVSVAASACEALSIFRAENKAFELSLIDVVLPDKSGIELAGDLRQHNPRIKILLNSGYMDHKSQWPLIEERGYPFMQKPYSL
ncbi:MAG TPA: response regulator, partial [bacterium]